jgi:hypothetical protein
MGEILMADREGERGPPRRIGTDPQCDAAKPASPWATASPRPRPQPTSKRSNSITNAPRPRVCDRRSVV